MSNQKSIIISNRALASIMLAGILAILLLMTSVPTAESVCGSGYFVQPGPQVETRAATDVEETTATINGELVSKGSPSTVFVSFVWGAGDYADCISECNYTNCRTNNCQDSTAVMAMSSSGTFSINLTGLQPETTYYFRAKAEAGGCDTDCDVCMTFTTKAGEGPCVSPEVETNEPTNSGTSSLQLNGTLEDMGSFTSGVEVFFEWGTDTTYGQQTDTQTVTGTGAFSALLVNLDPETDYHYRAVAVGCDDEHVNGSDTYGTTLAVGVCTSPEVETDEATDVEGDSAQINGSLLDMGSFTAGVEVFFEWGIDTTYGSETDRQTVNEIGPFSDTLENLEPGTVHFRAVAIGCAGTEVYGMDEVFAIEAAACIHPDVETNEATQIEMDSAILNGTLLNMGTPPMAEVEVSFEWGLDDEYGNETPVQILSAPETFNALLTNLEADTPYHFRAKASGCGEDEYVYGDDMILFTLPYSPPPTPIPPTVETGSPTGITETSVVLNGILEDLGNKNYNMVYFEWGTGESGTYKYTTKTEIMVNPGSFSATLKSLKCGSMYHYRAVAVGNGQDFGNNVSFATVTCGGTVTPPAGEPPIVETGTPMDIAMNSAILTGTLEDLGSAWNVSVSFEWDTDSDEDFQYETEYQTMSGTGSFAMLLQNLEPGTTYYYRAKGDGYATDYGDVMSFTTLKPQPDVITKTAKSEEVTTDSAVLEGMLESMGTASEVQVYFEWGPTMDYGNQTASQKMNDVGDFQAKIAGLDPDTDYHFRAKAIGDAEAVGNNMSFTTEGEDEGINALIVIGPIIGALVLGLIFFLIWRRRSKGGEA